MSLVLIPSNQHPLHLPDVDFPIMPGEPGYPVYNPNQSRPGEPPAPAGYGAFQLTSPPNRSIPQHGGYQYMGDYPPPMLQPMTSHGFVPGTNVNANAASTANAYPIPERISTFTPSNRSGIATATSTISPSQTQFDANDEPQFYEDSTAKGRHDSLYPKEEAPSPTTSTPPTVRRRRSEYAEPGSARAIYLEKNRKAASKCRSKQKMEQEVLVERAREMERSNRVLKAELHMLQGELRDLKELAGQHMNCSDQRMAIYLQKQANRLAAQLGLPSQH